MRKWIEFLILGMVFSAINAFAQWGNDNLTFQDTVFMKYLKDDNDRFNYVTDTLIFESSLDRNVFIGTGVLRNTHNQMGALEYGLYFERVHKSLCRGHEVESTDHDHINSVLATDSTLIIELNITDNCCYNFMCDISTDRTGTLNLIYTGYGEYRGCDCCFGLTYYLRINKEKGTPELKRVMVNGNNKTLKAKNKW